METQEQTSLQVAKESNGGMNEMTELGLLAHERQLVRGQRQITLNLL